jgi:hypothetical protein
MAPSASLELCRTVAEAVVPRRWPREVRCQKLGMFDFLDCLDRCVDCTVGSFGAQSGQFDYPRGLALTPDDAFLLVADIGNRRVVVLRATDGAWVRQLMGPPGTLQAPIGVSVVPSTGQVLVSDLGRHRVIQFQSIEDD